MELFEAVPNVSEGRRQDVLDALGAAVAEAGGPGCLLDVDADAAHHRAVVSLAGGAAIVEAALVALVARAAELIDLGGHAGVHPRVGAADVVPVVPLTGPLEAAAALARRLGHRIHDELGLPVFFYGAALGGPRLADIRAGRAAPDLGAPAARGSGAGAVCVGARAPLVAYNVFLPGASVEAAGALARAIRGSAAGGVPGVQALAFAVPDGMQLSMNLVDLETATPAAVLEEVRRRAAAAGLEAGPDEVVGLCPARCAPPAARGRVLESRLAAAGARRAAAAAAARGGEELSLLAGRLERTAAGIARLGPEGSELLTAAEQATALPRVVRAAAIEDAEALALLELAGAELWAAVPEEVAARFPERVRLAEIWPKRLQ